MVEFRVNVPNLSSQEHVRIIGDSAAFGNWKLENSLAMNSSKEINNNQWMISVDCDSSIISYRYLCCRFLHNRSSCNDNLFVVTRWETHLKPRFKNAGKSGTIVDEFGMIDSQYKVDMGWLTGQCEVRFTLHDSLRFWNSDTVSTVPLNITVKTLDFSRKQFEDGDSQFGDDYFSCHGECLIACLTDSNCSFEQQKVEGRCYKSSDYLTFKVQTTAPELLGFSIELWEGCLKEGADDAQNDLQLFAYAHVIHQSSLNDIDKMSFPLYSPKSRGRPVGDLKVSFLILRSMPIEIIPQDLSRSYVRYWNKYRPLNVGHRGMGSSYKKTALVRENTIASLNNAAAYGADFVEFDVHLSKDMVPVLYHDFSIRLEAHKVTNSDEHLFHEVCISSLLQNEMRHLRSFHETVLTPLNADNNVVEAVQVEKCQRPFPTLKEIFSAVDSKIGFNIEVKYAMRYQNGGCEAENRFPRNLYVDKILEEVFKHSTEKRKIIFSSFEPYICLMLKLKQNKYPVMFLTQGETKRYPPFEDFLTNSSTTAVSFAAANEFLVSGKFVVRGVCFHSESLLQNADAFQLARERNLVSFVWGDDLNDAKNIEYFKKLGLNGVIFDRINEYSTSQKDMFVLEEGRKKC